MKKSKTLNIEENKIMAFGPKIFTVNIEGIKKKKEALSDIIFLGSKITADGYCCHEFERHLLLGRKAMTHLNSVLKIKDNFAGKSLYCQSYDFSCSHV